MAATPLARSGGVTATWMFLRPQPGRRMLIRCGCGRDSQAVEGGEAAAREMALRACGFRERRVLICGEVRTILVCRKCAKRIEGLPEGVTETSVSASPAE